MLKHRLDFRTTTEDFNENGKIKLSSLLHFCQEVATEHADIIGIGMDELLKIDIIWVLVKMKLRILEDMYQDEDYYIVTYPRPQKSRYCPRDYYIYDKNDKLVVVGSSVWSLVNCVTRKMVRHELDFNGEFTTEIPFPEGFGKIRMKEPDVAGEYVVVEKDIDNNGHCNNCSYGDMVERVTDVKQVGEFLIQYSKETKLGETIQLHCQNTEDGQMISGTLADGETVFLTKLTTK